jgi:HEAT repeat protein
MGPDVIDELIQTLVCGDALVQKRAARALIYLGDEGLQAALKMMKVALEKEQMDTVTVLMAAVRESEHRGQEWKEFLPYLERTGPVRVKTLEVLGHLGDLSAFPSVLPYLNDADPGVRDEADNTLCLLADEDMGFEAEAPPAERARIVVKWKEWWDAASDGV